MKTTKELDISSRLKNVGDSPIRKLVPFAVAAKKRGIKVYHLNIGDPDIKTPSQMMKVLKTWDKNPIAYSSSQGEPVFLEALQSYYNGLGYRFITTQNIQVTLGGSEAISMALFGICEAGDEVITFEPFYANYNSYAAINSVKVVPIATDAKTGFHFPSQKEIEKRITKKTKAILICNPNNPTGTVYSKKEIEMLVSLAVKHGLYILSDEVYREYAYDGKKQTSLLDYMKKLPDRIIVLDSLSKRYSLCGARLGAIVSLNEELMKGVLRIAQGRLSAGIVDQHVAAKLTEVPHSYILGVVAEYKKRRDVLYDGLKKIPGVVIPKPEGAFYTIVGLPVDDTEHFCRFLLSDFDLNGETVMLAPAAGFYGTKGKGKKEVRIAYVINTRDLKKCVEILKVALQTYNKKSH